uniref:Glycosyl transferase group 1 n=1 Tax=Cyanothece sp. (strain PCC 7425 / ATCC 29141) TaxID=395961 RepID=B8HLJ4_CYAP4
MSARPPRIGIDFSGLDHLNLGNGQYRYAVTLIDALAKVPEVPAEFLVVGSRPDPVPELKPLFTQQSDRWHYHSLPSWSFKGAMYLDHLRYSSLAYTHRLDLWHSLHTFIPALLPCPIVVTAYDLMYELFEEYKPAIRSRPYQMYKWLIQHRVNHLLPISQTTANDLHLLWNIPRGKISVVPLGVDFTQAKSEQTGTSTVITPTTGLTILSPFNLEPRKNLSALLQALPRILNHYPNLKLILFGRAAWTAEREAGFHRLCQELSLSLNIILTGFISDAELAALYRQTTLFVFPTLYEGFGLPLLEAMAAGACVVARKHSSMAEIVADAGALVEPCDPDHLSAAILTLLDNPAQRQRLQHLGSERAREFTPEKMARQTWQVYQRVLDTSGSGQK